MVMRRSHAPLECIIYFGKQRVFAQPIQKQRVLREAALLESTDILAPIAQETVRQCYGLQDWTVQNAGDLLGALVASEGSNFGTIDRTVPASITAFALASVRKKRGEGSLVCEEEVGRIKSAANRAVSVERYQPGLPLRASLLFDANVSPNMFYPVILLPLRRMADCSVKRLSAFIEASAIWASALDMRQMATQRLNPNSSMRVCMLESGFFHALLAMQGENWHEMQVNYMVPALAICLPTPCAGEKSR
jgi:hypothetical protein